MRSSEADELPGSAAAFVSAAKPSCEFPLRIRCSALSAHSAGVSARRALPKSNADAQMQTAFNHW